MKGKNIFMKKKIKKPKLKIVSQVKFNSARRTYEQIRTRVSNNFYSKVYCRSSQGATTAPSLQCPPEFFLKIFSREMIKNDICIGVQASKMSFSTKKCALKNGPIIPPLSRLDPAFIQLRGKDISSATHIKWDK